MPEPTAESSSGPPSSISPHDFIHDAIPDGSRFGDEAWDYQAIRPAGHPTRWVRFSRIPAGYRYDVKLYALLQGRPHHPVAVDAGVSIRRDVGTMDAVLDVVDRLAVLTAWGQSKGLATFKDWNEKHADDFLTDLRSGKHREGGSPNALGH